MWPSEALQRPPAAAEPLPRRLGASRSALAGFLSPAAASLVAILVVVGALRLAGVLPGCGLAAALAPGGQVGSSAAAALAAALAMAVLICCMGVQHHSCRAARRGHAAAPPDTRPH
jgi:hypothetical protein